MIYIDRGKVKSRNEMASSQSSVVFDSQSDGMWSPDPLRRTETPIELNTQCFSSDVDADENQNGPSWFRLLDIIALNNILVVPDVDLRIVPNPSATDAGKKGTFGVVEVVNWKSDKMKAEIVAVKKFNKVEAGWGLESERHRTYLRLMRDVMFEVEIMSRCNHPNIVRLRSISFEETDNGLLCPMLAMEAANNECPDLEAWCEAHAAQAPYTTIAKIASGIAKGLEFFHVLGVIHADLKPSNILMFLQCGSWVPKLVDFGLSGITVSSDSPRGGTRRWNAPECLPDAPKDLKEFSVKPCRDMYAFGLVLSSLLLQGPELFSGFDGNVDAMKLNEKDIVAQYAWSRIEKVLGDSPGKDMFQTIIVSTLRRHPKDRLAAMGHITSLLENPTAHKLSGIRSWIRRDKTPKTVPDFLPFGHISPSQEYETGDIASIHSIGNLLNTSHLPKAFLKALISQFENFAIKRSLPMEQIPLGLCMIAAWGMSEEQLNTIRSKRPEFTEFLRDLNENSIKGYAKAVNLVEVAAGIERMIDVAISSHEVLQLHTSTDIPASPWSNHKAIPVWQITNIHRAAYRGDYSSLAVEIDGGQANYSHNDVLWTPLHSAVLGGNVRSVRMLLDAGADVNASLGGSSKYTLAPLQLAIVKDDETIIKNLLDQQNIDIWVREYGWWSSTTAHLAANHCDGDTIMKLLLSKDGKLARSRDVRKVTPLQRAAERKNLACVKLLLKYGADINSADVTLTTPLHKAYAAANGFQGVQETIAYQEESQTGLRSEQFITMDFNDMPDNLNGVPLSLFHGGKGESAWEMATKMHKSYEAVLAECPPGHDPFILFKSRRILRDTPPDARPLAENFLRGIETAKREWSKDEFACRLGAIHLPPQFASSSLLPYFEINVRTLVERFNSNPVRPINAKLPGQKGVTYLSDKIGREVVYYLISKGASPDAVNYFGRTPECYAYRPSDSLWTKSLVKDSLPQFSPVEAFTNGPVKYIDEGKVMEFPSLHVHIFKGKFSVWSWIPVVIPCPYGFRLTCLGGRLAEDHISITPSNFTIVIAVWMFPPNDSEIPKSLLFQRRVNINDLFSRPGYGFITTIGMVRVKHKCRLLVNLRSDALPEATIGGFILSGIRLDGSKAFGLNTDPELVSNVSQLAVEQGPLQTTTAIPRPQTLTEVRYLSPSFPKHTHWNPFIEPKPKSTLAPKVWRKVFEGNVMTLKEANPNLYTRRRIKTDRGTIYGPKEWHFDEKKEKMDYGFIRSISDDYS